MKNKITVLLIIAFISLLLGSCSSNSVGSNSLYGPKIINISSLKFNPLGHFGSVDTYGNSNMGVSVSGKSLGWLGSFPVSLTLDKQNDSIVQVFTKNYGITPGNLVSKFATLVMPNNSNRFLSQNTLNAPPANVNHNCSNGVGFCTLSNMQLLAYNPGKRMVITIDCYGSPNGSTWGWNGSDWIDFGQQPESTVVPTFCPPFREGSFTNQLQPWLFTYKDTVGLFIDNIVTYFKNGTAYKQTSGGTLWVFDNQSDTWKYIDAISTLPRGINSYYASYFPKQSEIVLVGFPMDENYGWTTYIYKNGKFTKSETPSNFPFISAIGTGYLNYVGNSCNRLFLSFDGEYYENNHLKNGLLVFELSKSNWQLVNVLKNYTHPLAQVGNTSFELPSHKGIVVGYLNPNPKNYTIVKNTVYYC
jgi:hypothetical protein